MEWIGENLRRTTTPDESTRPAPAACTRCGLDREPVWIPLFGCWAPAGLCDECHDRAREPQDLPVQKTAFAHMTFDTFEPETDEQQAALEVVRGCKSVWLWGRPGVGKTHLAAAAYNFWSGQGSVRFEKVPDLMGRLRTASLEGGLEAVIRRPRHVDLLVLDDIGVERPTPFAVECLYRVVDARFDAKRRTIVTSNLPPSQVAQRLGGPIISRLAGLCKVLEVLGPDRRILKEEDS